MGAAASFSSTLRERRKTQGGSGILRGMEQRQQPRITVPIEVDLNHASIGTVQTVTRDVSVGGIFVLLDDPSLPLQARVKVTLRNLPMIEAGPTPTVPMTVERIEQDGLALSFANRASEHLWNSVDRVRERITVGEDLFQVHQSAVVVSDEGSLLVVNEAGRWLYPGEYLNAGASGPDALLSYLEGELGLANARLESPLEAMTLQRPASEATVFSVFYRLSCSEARATLATDSRYREARWVSRRMEIEELTFSDEALRPLGYRALALAEAR